MNDVDSKLNHPEEIIQSNIRKEFIVKLLTYEVDKGINFFRWRYGDSTNILKFKKK